MEVKIRKQIYLDPKQNEILKQTSRKLGVSEAEVIRRAILPGSKECNLSIHLPMNFHWLNGDKRFMDRIRELIRNI